MRLTVCDIFWLKHECKSMIKLSKKKKKQNEIKINVEV